MAEKSSSRLRLDDFVNAVHADPANAEPTVLLAGYLGRSPEEGNVRVYLDPSLSNWLEVPEAEVIHSRPIADSPLGGSQLWVRASAQITSGAAGAQAPAAGAESGGEEGGAEKAAVGSDTGVFNPMATIHPTIWTQFCPTGVGCIATIPCLPPTLACPHGGPGQAGPVGPTGWHTCACPPGYTGWQGCVGAGADTTQQSTAATLCTRVSPCVGHTGWHTCACPIGPTGYQGCGQGGLGAVGPTGTQGCTQPGHCVGQTGWHTCACPIGPTGYQGCGQGGLGDVGPTGTQGCTQPGHCVGQTGWHTCACPAMANSALPFCTKTISCGAGAAVAQAAMPGPLTWTNQCPTDSCARAQAANPYSYDNQCPTSACAQAVGPTGTQGCTQPPHCVGPTGWQGCGGDAAFKSMVPACMTIGCDGGAGMAAVGPTGTQGCTQPGHCVGQTGWHTCACPLGPTGTQGCGGGAEAMAMAMPNDPTASTRCFICPPLGQGGYGAAQAALPGPTGMFGCTYSCGAQQNTAATLCTQVGCRQPGGPVITLVTVSGCQHPSWVDACPTRLCALTVSGPCLPYTMGGCFPGGRQY
jgi:hypothetical protein